MDCLLARVIEADGATGPLVPGDENHVIHDDRWSQLGALPVGARPFPSVVDFAGAPVGGVNSFVCNEQKDFITRVGFGELLERKD
jgi:hypothetical protein